jgi:hypothetical protein
LNQFTNGAYIKAVVIEPGINNKPASVAVHPKWIVYILELLMWNHYKPKPRISHKVPILKFRLSERLNLRLDIYRLTRQMNSINPNTETALNKTISYC